MNEQREKLMEVIIKKAASDGFDAQAEDYAMVRELADAILAAGFVQQGAGLSEVERDAVMRLVGIAGYAGQSIFEQGLAEDLKITTTAALRASRSDYEVAREFWSSITEEAELVHSDGSKVLPVTIVLLAERKLASMKPEATQ